MKPPARTANAAALVLLLSLGACSTPAGQAGLGMLDAITNMGAGMNHRAQSSGQSVAGQVPITTQQAVLLRNPDVSGTTGIRSDQAQDEHGRWVCVYTNGAVMLLPFGQICPANFTG